MEPGNVLDYMMTDEITLYFRVIEGGLDFSKADKRAILHYKIAGVDSVSSIPVESTVIREWNLKEFKHIIKQEKEKVDLNKFSYLLLGQVDRESGIIKQYLGDGTSLTNFVGSKDTGNADEKLPDILTIIPMSNNDFKFCLKI